MVEADARAEVDSDADLATDTDIVYVPGAENHYKYGFDVVVLDERLKKYPKAHEYIKNHELEHAKHAEPENRGFFEYVRLELQTDIDRYFSEREEIEEVREYFEERSIPQPLHPATTAKFSFADSLRGLCNFALRPLGWVYRLR